MLTHEWTSVGLDGWMDRAVCVTNCIRTKYEVPAAAAAAAAVDSSGDEDGRGAPLIVDVAAVRSLSCHRNSSELEIRVQTHSGAGHASSS